MKKIQEIDLLNALYEFGPAPSLIASRIGLKQANQVAILLRSIACVRFRDAYTEYVRRVIAEIRSQGPNKAMIARAMSMERHHVNAWIVENDSIRQIFDDTEESIKDLAKQGLVEALARRERWAVELVLRSEYTDKANPEKEAELLGIQLSQVQNELSHRFAGLLTEGKSDDSEVDIDVEVEAV